MSQTSVLNRISKALGPLKILIFSEDGVDRIKKVRINPFAFLILAAIIQAIPQPTEAPAFLINFATNIAIVAIMLTVLISIAFVVSRMLRSPIKFTDYIRRMGLSVFILSLLSIMIAFIVINFGMLIGYPEITFKLVQGSIITYYVFVVFGWCAERFAEFNDIKGVIVGVVAIALYYALHIAVSMLP